MSVCDSGVREWEAGCETGVREWKAGWGGIAKCDSGGTGECVSVMRGSVVLSGCAETIN